MFTKRDLDDTGKYAVKWSFYASKWWAGEMVTTSTGIEYADNVIYYDTFREAIDDIAERILIERRAA